MDILKLEKLVTRDRAGVDEDLLNRLILETNCPPDRADCRAERVGMEEGMTVNWEEAMREPKWAFDGRNIVDSPQSEELGFRVRATGKGLVL